MERKGLRVDPDERSSDLAAEPEEQWLCQFLCVQRYCVVVILELLRISEVAEVQRSIRRLLLQVALFKRARVIRSHEQLLGVHVDRRPVVHARELLPRQRKASVIIHSVGVGILAVDAD